MAEYGLYLGIAFQIADDALDYMAERETLGKTVGDDFREGKMTAPVLLALQKADDDERAFWQRTLSGRETSDKDLKQAQAILQRHDIYAQTLDMARGYGEKAIEALAEAPDHTLRPVLEELVRYSIERSS